VGYSAEATISNLRVGIHLYRRVIAAKVPFGRIRRLQAGDQKIVHCSEGATRVAFACEEGKTKTKTKTKTKKESKDERKEKEKENGMVKICRNYKK